MRIVVIGVEQINPETDFGLLVKNEDDAQYDGKDVPYTGSPDADTIALTRVDARTINAVLKKNGKVVQTTNAMTSAASSTAVTRTSAATLRLRRRVSIHDGT